MHHLFWDHGMTWSGIESLKMALSSEITGVNIQPVNGQMKNCQASTTCDDSSTAWVEQPIVVSKLMGKQRPYLVQLHQPNYNSNRSMQNLWYLLQAPTDSSIWQLSTETTHEGNKHLIFNSFLNTFVWSKQWKGKKSIHYSPLVLWSGQYQSVYWNGRDPLLHR